MSSLDKAGRRRVLVLITIGIAAAGVYLGIAGWTRLRGGGMAGLLYDGMAPPARYNWLDPPSVLASGNQPPASGTGTVTFQNGVSQTTSVYTDDFQAVITFPPATVVVRPGESAVAVTITPLDPAAVAQPPGALRFDGNAYEIRAVYASSRAPAVLRRPAVLILRYATGATHVLRSTDARWVVVVSTACSGTRSMRSRSCAWRMRSGPPSRPPGSRRRCSSWRPPTGWACSSRQLPRSRADAP